MATGTDKQQFSFQAEIKQLLHLLAHSLYQSSRDRRPRVDLERLRCAGQDAVHRADGRGLPRHGATGDRRRGGQGRPAVDHPRQRHRDDARRAGDEPRDDRAQRVARVPPSDGGEAGAGEGRRLADRTVRSRLLLGVYDRRRGAGPDPELPGVGGLGVGVGRLGDVHRRPRRGPRARHRGHPPPQGRCQGVHRGLADQGRHQALFELRPPPDQGRRHRSSTTRSRSGSSPRARSPTSSTGSSTST